MASVREHNCFKIKLLYLGVSSHLSKLMGSVCENILRGLLQFAVDFPRNFTHIHAHRQKHTEIYIWEAVRTKFRVTGVMFKTNCPCSEVYLRNVKYILELKQIWSQEGNLKRAVAIQQNKQNWHVVKYVQHLCIQCLNTMPWGLLFPLLPFLCAYFYTFTILHRETTEIHSAYTNREV